MYVMLGADKAGEGTEELSNREHSVADVVVEGTLVEIAREEVVAARVKHCFCSGGRWVGLVGWLVG